MQKVDQIIRTKIRLPLIRSGLVSRPKLQEQIKQGLCGPLTLMTSPAGFGKTTLAASSIAHCGKAVAWLSLDKNDNLAGRFLSYLVVALQAADPAVGSEAAQLLAASRDVPPEALLTSLINDLDTSGREMVLVFDDYQLINAQDVHEAVTFLLEHCPSTFHLMIATRSDPPLPLARFRARGQIVELRASDLRFSESEAAQFLNDMMGLQLDARSVAVLEERTEGWVAGLQMAALALQPHLYGQDRKDVIRFIEGFSGTNRYILDYLLEEVLALQPGEIQAFLLQTSILNRLTGPLCDAVTNTTGSQEKLEWLEKRNLFMVPLDDERHWYRYHHLFADLLQARLKQSGQDQIAQLLSRAAAWCEREGQVAESGSYAMAAQDDDRIADLIVKYWQPITSAGEIETVWSWLQALPEVRVKNSALLSVIYCRLLWLTGQDLAIEPHLMDAEHVLAEWEVSKGEGKENISAGKAFAGPYAQAFATLPAEIAGLRSNVAHYHGEPESARMYAERALSLIPEHLPPHDYAQMRAVFSMPLATAYDGLGDLTGAVNAYSETVRWSQVNHNVVGVAGTTYRLTGALRLLGRLRAADAACRSALAYIHAEGLSRVPAVGILHVAMSEVLVEQNDLETAEDHLTQGLELGKLSGRIKAVIYAGYALSRINHARQDKKGALVAVQEALSALGKTPSPLLKAELLAHKAAVLLRQDALNEAAACLEEAVQLAGRDRGQTGETVALAASRLLLARSRPDEAIPQLSQSMAAAEACGRAGMALELRILRSLAFARQGQPQQALADLERAYAIAEPEGFVRVFLDEGLPLQQLIAKGLNDAAPGPLREYAASLLTQFDAQSRAVAGPISTPNDNLIEPLSQRELEVLHLMALGRTNQEIARQLIVAPGTIKAHAASIYRKLDVANRTEAVARARQLGLIS